MFLFSLNVCTFAAMKRALSFNDQGDVSSDESSDDHEAESEQMSNNITVDQVDEELVSEGTKIICDHLDMVKCESEQMNDNFNIGQGVEELILKVGTKTDSGLYKCRALTLLLPDEMLQLNHLAGNRNLKIPIAITQKSENVRRVHAEHIPIPAHTRSVIPCTSWRGLAASIKNFYGQPLHYLTNLCMKQWDQMRIGADDEDPLDMLIHLAKAESSIWLMEEVNRRTTSPHYIARLWHADPMYHVYIDPIFPKLQNPSK
ncbi:hypothetical protein RND71_022739 [Anisodus tanguticus]|uniref:Uncharacterized protein n=1 Tax=Anisodus tanguticus TaxID=243964 RepID=A0AAE1VD78_9SOLA|nr:hypothetical protein RND71_022739 [Anisodus tanguticus]